MAGGGSLAANRGDKGERVVARNRRASFDYELEELFEAGIVLVGSEVKSLRAGKVEIVDAYAAFENGEIFLYQLHIGAFEQATVFGHELRRRRKLLLNRREIASLDVSLKDRGYTLIPTRLYFKDGMAKIEIALARGKTRGDKRQAIAKKDAAREARDAMARARKGRQ